ncbi:MAG TPA: hypothetical protein VFJ99_00115, partial [Solirubrobacterales bacterium]|nr:hypothetical protein [Solirubrobacterales bacterium]
ATGKAEAGGAARAAGRPAASPRREVARQGRLVPGARISSAAAPGGSPGSGAEHVHIGTAAAGGVDAAAVSHGGSGGVGEHGYGEHGASAEAHEAHPSGQGHPKQHPAAAQHGQETAAAHQPEHGEPKGKGRSESHPPPAAPAHDTDPEPAGQADPPEPPAPPEHAGGGKPPAAKAGEAEQGAGTEDE